MTKKRKKKGTWKKLMPRALVMTSLTTRASVATRCRMDGRSEEWDAMKETYVWTNKRLVHIWGMPFGR